MISNNIADKALSDQIVFLQHVLHFTEGGSSEDLDNLAYLVEPIRSLAARIFPDVLAVMAKIELLSDPSTPPNSSEIHNLAERAIKNLTKQQNESEEAAPPEKESRIRSRVGRSCRASLNFDETP